MAIFRTEILSSYISQYTCQIWFKNSKGKLVLYGGGGKKPLPAKLELKIILRKIELNPDLNLTVGIRVLAVSLNSIGAIRAV